MQKEKAYSDSAKNTDTKISTLSHIAVKFPNLLWKRRIKNFQAIEIENSVCLQPSQHSGTIGSSTMATEF